MGSTGSIPTPLTQQDIRYKQVALIEEIIKQGGTDSLFTASLSTDSLEYGENKTANMINNIEINNTEINNTVINNFLDNLSPSISGTYGGNTTCIEVQVKDSPLFIIDAGTGIRNLGNDLFVKGRLFNNPNPLNTIKSNEYNEVDLKGIHLLLTHFHWDHLQGFPFFGPAFIPTTNMTFYGKADARRSLSEALKSQQEYPNFPVTWDELPCQKNYVGMPRLNTTTEIVGSSKISCTELDHPDSGLAYAIERDGIKFVCATDTEHRDSPNPNLVELAKDAQILYYDAQYTPDEYRGAPDGKMSKFGWGHSTYEWAVKTALAANVSTVVLGHHEPAHNDFTQEDILRSAEQYKNEQLSLSENKGKKLEVIMGMEGLVQEI